MGGNTFHYEDIPRSGHEVATKAYVDSNIAGPRRIFPGYVPPLLSSSGVTSLMSGFIASASSAYIRSAYTYIYHQTHLIVTT